MAFIVILKIRPDSLQIGVAFVSFLAFITNCSSPYYYKSGQNSHKSGQLLQIGADLIQIRAAITNRGYYKLEDSTQYFPFFGMN